ncbi:coiled-coil-helix-coiled-coil-helix domain-containing protein 2-like [Anneissia japonica]|uniref:coiled-coil-helix-coiled-coil-helix domain-containing protein 2-like n=1 Tax=Anneissia japonica TaxID=1529436 RepID=UPI001425AB2D|nr:coiled-coil-helix-coiled-coil-helix domain-containing protein 2-like [Anneissia japonica]
MPRGGRSRGRSASPVRLSAPPRTVTAPRPQQRSPVPVQQQPSMVGTPGQSRSPGLFGQMAATAGGVAIGSAVGHAVGAAMTGGGGNSQPDVTYQEQQPMQQYQPVQQQNQQNGACSYELQQFLHCAETQHDLSLCDGFNEALRQCKLSFGK